MDSLRYSQELRQRVHRHNRLMKMIHGYNRTAQQTRKLEKIKSNTMMEINIRYLRCQHNRQYKFPLTSQEQSQQEEINFDPLLSKKQNLMYDLNSQNSLKPSRTTSKKNISLESSRRVISLQVQRNDWQRQRLLRLDLKAKNHNISSKHLTRKNSFSQKLRAGGSRIRLPELKIERYRQNLKTQSRAPEQQQQIQSVISKKLITQSCEGRKKMNGVEKYLQKIQPKAIKTKIQRLHRD